MCSGESVAHACESGVVCRSSEGGVGVAEASAQPAACAAAAEAQCSGRLLDVVAVAFDTVGFSTFVSCYVEDKVSISSICRSTVIGSQNLYCSRR